MPVHDRTRVHAGLFPAFHQRWIGALCGAQNTGGLPALDVATPPPRARVVRGTEIGILERLPRRIEGVA